MNIPFCYFFMPSWIIVSDIMQLHWNNNRPLLRVWRCSLWSYSVTSFCIFYFLQSRIWAFANQNLRTQCCNLCLFFKDHNKGICGNIYALQTLSLYMGRAVPLNQSINCHRLIVIKLKTAIPFPDTLFFICFNWKEWDYIFLIMRK